MENLPDSIYFKDMQSRFLRVNHALARSLRFSDPAQMVGKTDADFFTSELARKTLADEQEIIRTGLPLLNIEEKSTWPDGTSTWVLTSKLPLRDAGGSIIGTFGISTDITERKRAEEALRERDEQLLLFVEHSPAAIAMLDRDMKYLVVSQRWREARQLDDQSIIGRSHYEDFPDIPERLKEIHQRCLAGAVEKCDEDSILLADGMTEWSRWEIRPWYKANGSIGGIIIFSENITGRKEAETAIKQLNVELQQRASELEAANKELEAFCYSISHDLKTPLRHIDGFSTLLLKRYAEQLPEEARSLLRTVGESSKSMGQLISDLLNFSQLGRKPVSRQTVKLSRLVREVFDQVHTGQEGRQIEFRAGTLPDCAGDASLLRQVFVNLLANALKFTRKRELACIEVGCEEQPEELVYFVRDNGAGFDMRYVHKLFGVFQRLHGASEFEGTGIGLSIVQRIIQRHGGRIWAEAGVDKGATFHFTLPRPA